MNCSIRMAPDSDLHYAGDLKWWLEYQDDWRDHAGLKYTVNQAAPKEFPCVTFIGMDSRNALSLDPSKVATGGNSGYQAIGMAFHLGATEIYLLGFDCKAKDTGGNHWHSDHDPHSGYRLTNPTAYLYKLWKRNFAKLSEALEENGVKLINCSRDTALTIPRRSLEECLL